MRLFLLLFTIFNTTHIYSQNEINKYKILNTNFKNEIINILITSKEGEENIKKPLILYIQGSLSRPLIINYPNNKNYKYSLAFPFNTEKILEKYHLAVVSKPFIPVVVDIKDLNKNYEYISPITEKPPINFLKNNNLPYFKKRFFKITKFLNKQPFVEKNRIILIGHSEGSRIAYEIAKKRKSIFALIHLSGNPFGRYLNTVQRKRDNESNDSFLESDNAFNYWVKISLNKEKNNYKIGGDTFMSWYEYSTPYFKGFLKIKKNVFIGYGTKDYVAPYNDLFKFQVLLNGKNNFSIHTYLGLEHSFYKKDENGVTHHDTPYFDKVISDVLKWLNTIGL